MNGCNDGNKGIDIFNFKGEDIRVLIDEHGDPWWPVVDLARILGFGHVPHATRLLREHHKGVQSLDTPGRPQQMVVASEGGLYRLIMRSNREEAIEFQDFVTDVMLPQIRKTGSYSMTPQVPQTMAAALRLAADELERRELAEMAEVFLGAEGTMSLRQAALALVNDHHIDTGRTRLAKALKRFQMVDGDGVPYARHRTHLRLRPTSYPHPRTGKRVLGDGKIVITPRGLEYIRRRYLHELGLGAQPENLPSLRVITGDVDGGDDA